MHDDCLSIRLGKAGVRGEGWPMSPAVDVWPAMKKQARHCGDSLYSREDRRRWRLALKPMMNPTSSTPAPLRNQRMFW